jgi:hypothetical protein
MDWAAFFCSTVHSFCSPPESMVYSWRDKSYSYMKYIGHLNQNIQNFCSRRVKADHCLYFKFPNSFREEAGKSCQEMAAQWVRTELQLNAAKSETVRTTRMSGLTFSNMYKYLFIFFINLNMAFSGGGGRGRGEAFEGEAGRAEDLQC